MGRLLALSVGLPLLLVCASNKASPEELPRCTSDYIGVEAISSGNDGKVFRSVARAKLVNRSEDFIMLVKAEAELLAKRNLKRFDTVPKDERGLLVGVLVVQHCILGQHIYSSVQVSEKTSKQAIQLRKQMLPQHRSVDSYSVLFD